MVSSFSGRWSRLNQPISIAFMRLSDDGRPPGDPADEGGRDPVLLLIGNDMVHDVEERQDLDLETVLFHDFARQGVLERFPELHAPAGKLPFARFVPRFFPALGKKDPVVAVIDDGADTDADMINTFFHVRAQYQKSRGMSKGIRCWPGTRASTTEEWRLGLNGSGFQTFGKRPVFCLTYSFFRL